MVTVEGEWMKGWHWQTNAGRTWVILTSGHGAAGGPMGNTPGVNSMDGMENYIFQYMMYIQEILTLWYFGKYEKWLGLQCEIDYD